MCIEGHIERYYDVPLDRTDQPRCWLPRRPLQDIWKQQGRLDSAMQNWVDSNPSFERIPNMYPDTNPPSPDPESSSASTSPLQTSLLNTPVYPSALNSPLYPHAFRGSTVSSEVTSPSAGQEFAQDAKDFQNVDSNLGTNESVWKSEELWFDDWDDAF